MIAKFFSIPLNIGAFATTPGDMVESVQSTAALEQGDVYEWRILN